MKLAATSAASIEFHFCTPGKKLTIDYRYRHIKACHQKKKVTFLAHHCAAIFTQLLFFLGVEGLGAWAVVSTMTPPLTKEGDQKLVNLACEGWCGPVIKMLMNWAVCCVPLYSRAFGKGEEDWFRGLGCLVPRHLRGRKNPVDVSMGNFVTDP